MLSVITINDKDGDRVGMVSVKVEDNKIHVNASPFVPLSKEDTLKLIKTLELHIKELK